MGAEREEVNRAAATPQPSGRYAGSGKWGTLPQEGCVGARGVLSRQRVR